MDSSLHAEAALNRALLRVTSGLVLLGMVRAQAGLRRVFTFLLGKVGDLGVLEQKRYAPSSRAIAAGDLRQRAQLPVPLDAYTHRLATLLLLLLGL